MRIRVIFRKSSTSIKASDQIRSVYRSQESIDRSVEVGGADVVAPSKTLLTLGASVARELALSLSETAQLYMAKAGLA